MNDNKPTASLVIACGALAHEITALMAVNQWGDLKVQCVPAKLHNTPDKIPDAVRTIIQRARPRYREIFVAFADCGTGGLLDKVLREENVERLPGAHCYEFFAGAESFAQMSENALGTFYLTDFLARHFDRLILEELGIKKHPELRDMYFSNYEKMIYLAQTDNPQLEQLAQDAAASLSLEYEYRRVGYGELESGLQQFNDRVDRVNNAAETKIVKWQN